MTRMLSLLCVLLAVELAAPRYALAECPTITSLTASGVTDATCVRDVMVLGQRGTWFDMENSDRIIRAKLLNEQLTLQVDEYSRLITLWKKENKELRNAVTLRDDAMHNLQAQLTLANKDAREARAELASYPRWYKSPIFWGITMFIAGAAIQNVCCSGR